jgi:FtsH-binding integral membrane protein
MNISPGLWLGVSLLVTGAISVHFSRKLSKSQVLPRLLVAACVISIGLAIVVIYFDQKFLLDYKVWLWRKQRMTTDPNHYEVDTKYQQFYVVRNKLDIEALFILGACLMGLTVVEIVLLVISISTASRFLCACCSETAFVSTNNTFKARTSIIMVPSRDNLLLSLPLLTTEL